ncbi:MAG: transposase [Acidobacteria bacterium]|nr:transposase [Acidobacteriota bacterium]
MSEFNMLFESFSNVFTSPSFLHFQALMISLWALPQVTGGQMSLARIWLAAGLSTHWDATARFVRSYRWSQEELAQSLTLFVLSQVKHRLPTDKNGKRVLLVGVDETLDDHHSAKKMFGVSRHFNSAARAGQSRYRIGHCWVTLSILIDVRVGYVRALCINIALYIARSGCDESAYTSKRELATKMLEQLSAWVSDEYLIAVVGDRYYASRDWINTQRGQKRRVVTRLRADARLYEIARARRRKEGQRGRSKKYGEKISLRHRATHLEKFEEEQEMVVYGSKQLVRLRKMLCYWRGVREPVSVVIVVGIGKKPFYLLDTDVDATAAKTLYFYAARHGVEQGYEDLKCDGGLGHYRGRTELGVRRFAMLSVTSQTLLRLMELIPELHTLLPKLEEPWRETKEHLSLGQIRLAIGKLLMAEYSRTGNFFNVGKRVEDEENYQTSEKPLNKAA